MWNYFISNPAKNEKKMDSLFPAVDSKAPRSLEEIRMGGGLFSGYFFDLPCSIPYRTTSGAATLAATVYLPTSIRLCSSFSDDIN